VDPNTASSAISAALPTLIGAMARNTRSQEGANSLANALERDHDGSILENMSGFLASQDNGSGPGILKHLFGDNRGSIEQGVSQMAGLQQNQTSSLLENLAPVVMGMLGQTKRQQGLDAGGIASLLGGLTGSAASNQGSGSAALSMLNSLMDRDGDGSALDDIGGMLGGLFGGKK
jgi:hypothetical protein